MKLKKYWHGVYVYSLRFTDTNKSAYFINNVGSISEYSYLLTLLGFAKDSVEGDFSLLDWEHER